MNKQARFQHIDDYLDRFVAQTPTGFSELRQQAALDLQHYGFPALKTESWKYTNAAPLLKQVYQTAEDRHIDKKDIASLLLADTHHIVFVNGFFHAELSNIDDPELTILPLDIAIADKRVKSYFGRAIPMQQTGFTALNTLLFPQAYLLQINAAISKPVQMLHIAVDLNAETAIHQRHLIILAENASVDLMQQHVSWRSSSAYWRNSASEIFLAADARLNHYKLQCEAKEAKHTDFISIEQAENSVCYNFNLDLGGQLVRNDLQTKLCAAQASCEFNGLYLTQQKQHIDNHTTIDHMHPHTYSKEYYKGILAGHSHAVFNGRVVVREDAQKIKSEQKNANLLLSNEAEIDTKPELEIYADDVICAHGATVGQLSEKAIFYLQSRGISEALAKKLLTYGFAYEVIEEIENTLIQKYIAQHLTMNFADDLILQELLR